MVRQRESTIRAASPLRIGVCAALLGSAVVHATVVGEHLEEWVVAGLFFLVLALVEVVLAVCALYAWNRRTAAAVALISLGTVAVWSLSRTTGMPIGPADFRVPEAVGVPDVACCVLELAAVVLCLPLLLRARTRAEPTMESASAVGSPRQAVSHVLVAGVLVALAAVVTGWGLQPAAAHDHGTHAHGGDARTARPERVAQNGVLSSQSSPRATARTESIRVAGRMLLTT